MNTPKISSYCQNACVIIIINKHSLDKHSACSTWPPEFFLTTDFSEKVWEILWLLLRDSC